MQTYKNTFNFSIEDLWSNVETLNNLEIFDLYENEVVKVSDQILSTYLFYKIVFVDKKVDISLFLISLFPQYRQKFTDVINPLLNIFDSSKIRNVLKEPVDKLWDKNIDNEPFIYDIIGVFWYLKQTDIQSYLSKKIDTLEEESYELEKINFWATHDTNESEDKILEKLSVFRYDYPASIRIAIELILKYFSKKPSLIMDVIKIISNNYVYNYDSYRYDYEKEHITLNAIWGECKDGTNELMSKLFIRICDDFLKIECEEHRFRKRTFSSQYFKLVEREKLELLRSGIFIKLSTLYKNEKYKNDILILLRKYPSHTSLHFETSKIEIWDSENIIKFINENFISKSYQEVKTVQILLEYFENCSSLAFDKNLKNLYTHEIYDLEKILILCDSDIYSEFYINEEENDFDKISEIRKHRLYEFVKDYKLADWEDLFEKSKIIEKNNSKDNRSIGNNLAILFVSLAENNQELYLQVLDGYLKLGNPFKLRFYPAHLYKILGKDKTKKFINQYEFSHKNDCLFNLYDLLKEEDIDKSDIEELLELYKNTDAVSVPNDLDYLKKYIKIERDIFVFVVHILVERATNENPQFFNGFKILFRHTNEISKNIETYFKKDMKLIQQCYLISMENNQHHDFHAIYLNKLIEYDNNFLELYIDKLFDKKEYLTKYDIHSDFSILWEREDFENIFFNLIELIIKKTSTKRYYRYGEILEAFFELDKNKSSYKNLNYCIEKFIDKFANDKDKITFLFDFISTLNHDLRKKYILHFLKNNKSFELFDKLSLEPASKSTNGSWVPVYQKEMDFYKSLLSDINGIDFLEHRQKIDKRISSIERDIKMEKKRDFMDDY